MKYADLIRDALDGKKIQARMFQLPSNKWSEWHDVTNIRVAVAHMAAEYSLVEYREAPPPPVVKEFYYNVYSTKTPFFGDVYRNPAIAKTTVGMGGNSSESHCHGWYCH